MKLERGLVAALGGAALLVAVVVWRLARASYPADVATLCDAERLSGFGLDAEPAALDDWIRGRLATPDGQALYSRIGDTPAAERATELRAAAAAVGLRACATADAHERRAAAGTCRADVQGLCSFVTFPGLADDDDDARVARLEAWLADGAGHPCAGALAGALRAAPGPVARAALLRATAKAAGVFTCDIARVVEAPRVVDAGGADAARPDAGGADAAGPDADAADSGGD